MVWSLPDMAIRTIICLQRLFSENAFPFHHVLHVSKTKMKCIKFKSDVAEVSMHVIVTYQVNLPATLKFR